MSYGRWMAETNPGDAKVETIAPIKCIEACSDCSQVCRSCEGVCNNVLSTLGG